MSSVILQAASEPFRQVKMGAYALLRLQIVPLQAIRQPPRRDPQ